MAAYKLLKDSKLIHLAYAINELIKSVIQMWFLLLSIICRPNATG